MNLLGFSKVDGGCNVNLMDQCGNILQQEKNCECNNCNHRHTGAECAGKIFSLFLQERTMQNFKTREGIAYETFQLQQHTFKHRK